MMWNFIRVWAAYNQIAACMFLLTPCVEGGQLCVVMLARPSGSYQVSGRFTCFVTVAEMMNTYPPQRAALELDTKVKEAEECGDRKTGKKMVS